VPWRKRRYLSIAWGLFQAETGETILHLGIGQKRLAFVMPTNATEELGQSLLAMTAFTTSHGRTFNRVPVAK
jgi:hypothetical protein